MTRFLNLQEVIELHDLLINDFGGRLGVRDMGLLTSALEMPKAQIGGKFLHHSLFDQAAAYLFHLSRNHPFIDGNKRTAAISTLVFLENNLISLEFNEIQFEKLAVKVAAGVISKEEISRQLESWKF